MALNDSKLLSNLDQCPATQRRLLCGALHCIVDTLRTFLSKIYADFVPETTTKGTLDQPTSSFLGLPAVCVYSALSCPEHCFHQT